jgi:hypothetical protein
MPNESAQKPIRPSDDDVRKFAERIQPLYRAGGFPLMHFPRRGCPAPYYPTSQEICEILLRMIGFIEDGRRKVADICHVFAKLSEDGRRVEIGFTVEDRDCDLFVVSREDLKEVSH